MLVCSVVELSCISASAAATGCGSWWRGQRCSVQHVDIVVHVWILHRLLSRMSLLHICSLLSSESAVHTECRYAVLRSGIEWMLAAAAYSIRHWAIYLSQLSVPISLLFIALWVCRRLVLVNLTCKL